MIREPCESAFKTLTLCMLNLKCVKRQRPKCIYFNYIVKYKHTPLFSDMCPLHSFININNMLILKEQTNNDKITRKPNKQTKTVDCKKSNNAYDNEML